MVVSMKDYFKEEQNNIVLEQNSVTNTVKNTVNTTTKNTTTKNTITKNTTTTKNTVNKVSNINQWKIVIPKINLEAWIAEGTTSEVMNSYVGHFEQTATLEGNIGLAAHNRGYLVNYFQNIKKLQKGDLIEYFWKNIKKQYRVETVTVITDTDWTYLAQTKDNRITLITCVENQPNYRRCIQAVEIK